MTPIKNCIINKDTSSNPIWLMRQAGRYLPEFREIRKKNTNFIELCLNSKLSEEITLQPIDRFNFDAAIIFSDILMVPYGIGQEVVFKKNFGPSLGSVDLDKLMKLDNEFLINKLSPVYDLLENLSKNEKLKNKDLIGFVGAPWTLLVYMLNKASPKNGLNDAFFKNPDLVNHLLNVLDRFIKIHIKKQVSAGATPVICFPRGITNYSQFCKVVKPSMINIDYNVDPKNLIDEIDIPIQGGLDPKILLTDKINLKNQATKYLEAFKNHPYVFNLGHGILPETKIEMVHELVKIVRDYK